MRDDRTSNTEAGTFDPARRAEARRARVFCSLGTPPEVRIAVTEHLLLHPLPEVATGTLTYTHSRGKNDE